MRSGLVVLGHNSGIIVEGFRAGRRGGQQQDRQGGELDRIAGASIAGNRPRLSSTDR